MKLIAMARLCASVATFAIAGGAMANAETIWKVATAAPENSPWQMQIDRLVADVIKHSDGRVKPEVFYSSQLGAENDVIGQVVRGRVDMGLFTLSALMLQVPELAVLDMPLFFEDRDQRNCVLDDHMVAPVTAALADKGMVFGTWFESGSGYIMGHEELPTPASLKGRKIGVTMNVKNEKLFSQLGSAPIATPVPEAASNDSTGLIDAYATVYPFYVPSGLNEILPVVTEFRYSDGPAILTISRKSWDRLDEADQKAVRAAFAEVPARQIRDEVAAFEDQLREKHLQGGGKIRKLDDAETAAFRDGLPGLWEDLGTGQGAGAEQMYRAMLAARSACTS